MCDTAQAVVRDRMIRNFTSCSAWSRVHRADGKAELRSALQALTAAKQQVSEGITRHIEAQSKASLHMEHTKSVLKDALDELAALRTAGARSQIAASSKRQCTARCCVLGLGAAMVGPGSNGSEPPHASTIRKLQDEIAAQRDQYSARVSELTVSLSKSESISSTRKQRVDDMQYTVQELRDANAVLQQTTTRQEAMIAKLKQQLSQSQDEPTSLGSREPGYSVAVDLGAVQQPKQKPDKDVVRLHTVSSCCHADCSSS